MPEHWDPDYYRERAKAWRDKATTLPEDHPERAVCIELADGYDKLATLLEQRAGVALTAPQPSPTPDRPCA